MGDRELDLEGGSESVPPPPSSKGRGFAEAERALALVEGKDPEKVRLARLRRAQDDLEASEAAKRIAERKRVASEERAQRNRRSAIIVLCVAGVGTVIATVVALGWKSSKQRTVDEGNLSKLTAPWERRGFSTLAQGFGVDASAQGDLTEGCVVMLASNEAGEPIPAQLVIGDTPRQVEGPSMQCFCDPIKLKISAHDSAGKRVGVAILRVSGASLGGPIVIPSLDLPNVQLTPSSEACARAMFDAFASQKVAPSSSSDVKVPPPVKTALERVGFRWVASSANREFAVVPGEKDGCYVAITSSKDEKLSLRVDAGKRAIEEHSGGAIVWCDGGVGPRSVWRSGAADGTSGGVDVFAGPSRRVGGVLGLRAITRTILGVEPATWVAPTLDVLRRDAQDALVASGALVSSVRPLDVAAVQRGSDARMVALSLSPDATFSIDATVKDKIRCVPALEPGVLQTVCAQASAALWEHVSVKGMIGAAEAPLPPWANALANATEVPALLATAELFAATRVLSPERYDPVLFEGVRDLGASVDVIGRAGEDSIAAIGLTPQLPWVAWLTQSNATRKAGGSSVVPLKPGGQVVLAFSNASARPSPDRRIVVFRRPME